MQARLATTIGQRLYLRIFSSGVCDKYSYCNAMKHLYDEIQNPVPAIMHIPDERVENYEEEEWNKICEHCGKEIVNGIKQIHQKRLYDTPSGDLEPGCLYWNTWYPKNFFWDNHDGPHLMAVLPNNNHWNIDSRASNCTMPDDKIHRCWVRHGEVPNITVDKNGNTCQAGGGSIEVRDYHGFLQNGNFT